jgi:TrmH family RNA methyltransferase
MITSKDNPQVKELKKLQQKRFRLRRNQFAAEGEDLVAAALAEGWVPDPLFCTPDAAPEFLNHPNALEVETELLANACALGSGARVVGVFPQGWALTDGHGTSPAGGLIDGVAEKFDPLFGEGWHLVDDDDVPALSLHLEGVADPGNIGTLLRSANAFADGRVSLGAGCADPYSPKALRAAMGATFAKPPGSWAQRTDQTTVIALDGSGDLDIRDFQPSGPVVLCAGGERDGLSDRTLQNADVVARIAMRPGGPESLNVAMATTIALFEISSKLQSGVHATAANRSTDGNSPSDEK